MPSSRRRIRPTLPLPATLALVAVLALIAVTCAPSADHQHGNWTATRVTVGDTITVRTIHGSIWGAPATLREDLSIGVLEGPEELMFGGIGALAVDSIGGIYLFDSQVPALRYFDSTGTYVRTLGGKGAGPGEY